MNIHVRTKYSEKVRENSIQPPSGSESIVLPLTANNPDAAGAPRLAGAVGELMRIGSEGAGEEVSPLRNKGSTSGAARGGASGVFASFRGERRPRGVDWEDD